MDSTVSFIIPTHNRPDDLRDAVKSILRQTYSDIEVVVVCDSTDDTPTLFEQGGPFEREDIVYEHVACDLNPSSARNLGAELATGEVFVFLDDDAVLVDPGATDRVVEAFESNERVGVFAFCIRDYDTDELNEPEFPHSKRPPQSERRFSTTYFVGAGFAIRAAAFSAADGFTPYLNRFEEVDISFRVLDRGYRIEYLPAVTVEHKNAPSGERFDQEMIREDLVGRITTSVLNLPLRYVVVSSVIWTVYTLYRTRFDPRPLVRAYWSLLRTLPHALRRRNVIDSSTVRYLKDHDGRLRY